LGLHRLLRVSSQLLGLKKVTCIPPGAPLKGTGDNDIVSYSYLSRLRTGLSLLQPNASPWTQSYDYDAAKRFSAVTSPAGQFVDGVMDGVKP
jgi:hypothetical protein